jgi:hypothetical protein
MTTTGLAIATFLVFIFPVPLLSWLDRPRGGADRKAE